MRKLTKKGAAKAWLAGFTVLVALALGLPVQAQPQREVKPSRSSAAAKKPKPAATAAVSSQKVPRAAVPPAAAPRAAVRRVAATAGAPVRPSYGQVYGLHGTGDPLELKSSVALVLDTETDEVLLSKNSQAVLPIASITKLMTAMVVADAELPLDEELEITDDDVDTVKGSGSRLAVGTRLSRAEMLHLALMSSENRAAHALGRHYPGGLATFVQAMNAKAKLLGMNDTRYVETTGLSSANQSSAHDLALLVKATDRYPLIRELSTTPEARVAVGRRQLQFRNTNGLVHDPHWEILVQKTGYISEAGRCVVMQAQLAGRKLVMVLLDSAGRYSRIGDAERIRKWVTSSLLPRGSEVRAR